MAYLNRRGIESKPTDHTMIQSLLNNSSKSSFEANRNEMTTSSATTQPQYRSLKGNGHKDGNGNEMTGSQSHSISNTSNPISTSKGSVFPEMDQTNSTIGSEENSITIHDKTDNSSLSKSDSIHSTLVFSDDCYSFEKVSINSWILLERLVIGDRCCSKTQSFEICHCPKLKSIKVGKQSFYKSSCYIFGIEL